MENENVKKCQFTKSAIIGCGKHRGEKKPGVLKKEW
jgi:hypothetical protein